jgi:hypothetical protein
MTPNHGDVLPECVKEHSSVWQFFWGTAAFFVLFLSITTPIVVATTAEMRKDIARGELNLKEAQLLAAQQHAEMIARFDDRTAAIWKEVEEMKIERAKREAGGLR